MLLRVHAAMSQPSNRQKRKKNCSSSSVISSLIPRRIASLAKKGKEIPTAAATGSGRAGSSKGGVGCRRGALLLSSGANFVAGEGGGGATTVCRYVHDAVLFIAVCVLPSVHTHPARKEGGQRGLASSASLVYGPRSLLVRWGSLRGCTAGSLSIPERS